MNQQNSILNNSQLITYTEFEDILTQVAPNWLRGDLRSLYAMFETKNPTGHTEATFNMAEFLLLLALFSKSTLRDKLNAMFDILLLF